MTGRCGRLWPPRLHARPVRSRLPGSFSQGASGCSGSCPLRAFAELAFAMGVGVLIDSFIVRSFLVPALVSLFGSVGSWPGRRLRTPEELETARA